LTRFLSPLFSSFFSRFFLLPARPSSSPSLSVVADRRENFPPTVCFFLNSLLSFLYSQFREKLLFPCFFSPLLKVFQSSGESSISSLCVFATGDPPRVPNWFRDLLCGRQGPLSFVVGLRLFPFLFPSPHPVPFVACPLSNPPLTLFPPPCLSRHGFRFFFF